MFRLNRKEKERNHISHSSEFFHRVIVGRSGCGKTKLLVRLLETEFYKKFNAIFIIYPTFEKNTSYSSFHSDDKVYILPGSVDNLEHSIHLAREEACKYHRSLIVFDDIIGNSVITSRTSKYVNLLIGGRHDGISTITLTQQLTSVSKHARDQMTSIISFYNPDGDDRKIMFSKYLCDVSREELCAAIQFLREKDYSYIHINILKGTYTLH